MASAKASIEVDVLGTRRQLPLAGSGKAPGAARQLHLRCVVVGALEQAIAGVFETRWRIGHLAKLAERDERAVRTRLHATYGVAGNRGAVHERFGRRKAEAGGDAPLPADGGEGEAALEQKAVAGRTRIGEEVVWPCPIEHRERQPPSAVRNVDQERACGFAVASGDGVDECEVAAKADLAIAIPGRVGEIDHGGVARRLGIDRIVNAAVADLERAEVAEQPATGIRPALGYLEPLRGHGTPPVRMRCPCAKASAARTRISGGVRLPMGWSTMANG